MSTKIRGLEEALGRAPRHGSKVRAWSKRQHSKAARRIGKRMMEDAPSRIIRGWAD